MSMEFMEFESMEAAFAYMHAQEEEANKNLAPEQKGIGYGDYWIRFNLDPAYGIFGRVMTEEEIRDAETPLGDDADEVTEILATLADSHARGYRYGRAFSVIVPEGELGDTHVANMWPIDHTLYEAAQKVDWHIGDLDEEAMAQLSLAYTAWRAHMLNLRGGQTASPLFRGDPGGGDE